MKKTIIFEARLSLAVGSEMYQYREYNEAEYGHEWNGDVQGYVKNLIDSEQQILDNISIYGSHGSEIIIGDLEGNPQMVFWAEEVDEEPSDDWNDEEFLKIEEATSLFEQRGNFAGPATVHAILKQIPDELISSSSAQVLALIMDAINQAFQNGKKEALAEIGIDSISSL